MRVRPALVCRDRVCYLDRPREGHRWRVSATRQRMTRITGTRRRAVGRVRHLRRVEREWAFHKVVKLIPGRTARALAPLGRYRARDTAASSAIRSAAGNAFPRLSARRRIPAHALGLK